MNCFYCGIEIDKNESSEHVIQNALGGLLESKSICCGSCNNKLQELIDADFVKMFNPFLDRIDALTKTHGKNSNAPCRGFTEYEGVTYDAIIKDKKISSSPALSKKLKQNIKEIKLSVGGYYFDVDNAAFNNGFKKIAINYALSVNISHDLLRANIEIEKSDSVISKIKFNNELIPFVALNEVDCKIELETPIRSLYHHIILFNEGNMLWCYIDLFNTFQFYVKLSNTYNGEDVNQSYCQRIQSINREDIEIPKFMSIKDIDIISRQYGVEPSCDTTGLAERIKTKIRKESVKDDDISNFINTNEIGNEIISAVKDKSSLSHNNKSGFKNLVGLLSSISLYFDQDDNLKNDTFRIVTNDIKNYIVTGDIVSYPLLIANLHTKNEIGIQEYTNQKFYRLCTYLG